MAIEYLDVIRAPQEELDAIERRIIELLKAEIYLPAIRLVGLPSSIIQNAADLSGFQKALAQGRITFNRGTFSGKFNAETTKALKKLGAKWDTRTKTFKLPLGDIPQEIRSSISANESRFQAMLDSIDARLSKVVPEEISKRLDVSKLFDRSLWRVDKEFRANVKGIAVAPELTDEQAAKISSEWQTNLRGYVENVTKEQVQDLRFKIRKTIDAGNRYGSLVGTIKKGFSTSQSRAEFLAQQESRLLTAKYQETRYLDAGIPEYSWLHVVGSPEHPVRPRHFALGEASKVGVTYRWDAPPITTEPGEPERRNNPGGDYRCRCGAKPVVRFKK